jgi:hypothetical protein
MPRHSTEIRQRFLRAGTCAALLLIVSGWHPSRAAGATSGARLPSTARFT